MAAPFYSNQYATLAEAIPQARAAFALLLDVDEDDMPTMTVTEIYPYEIGVNGVVPLWTITISIPAPAI